MRNKRIGYVMALLATCLGASTALAARGGGVLLNPVNLPAGKSFTVTFDVTVNDPFPQGVNQVQTQGNVATEPLGNVLTDDPDTQAAGDPTITGIVVPLCGRADGCFRWDLLSIDESVAGEVGFVWTLTNNCTSALSRADFRFLPGATVLGTDGDTYTAPSTRSYTVDIVVGAPHQGVAFVPNGAGLPAGEFEEFAFRVDASTLQPDLVLWNIATTTTAETGRLDMRSDLCFTLQPTLQFAEACYQAAGNQWDIEVKAQTIRAASNGSVRLYRVEAAHPNQPALVTGGPFTADASGVVRFTETRPAGSVLAYQVEALSREGLAMHGPMLAELESCAPAVGPKARDAWRLTLFTLGIASLLIGSKVARRRRGKLGAT